GVEYGLPGSPWNHLEGTVRRPAEPALLQLRVELDVVELQAQRLAVGQVAPADRARIAAAGNAHVPVQLDREERRAAARAPSNQAPRQIVAPQAQLELAVRVPPQEERSERVRALLLHHHALGPAGQQEQPLREPR